MAMSAIQAQGGIPAGEKVTVTSRFGTFEFERDQTISMPHGLLGFAGFRDFGLAAPRQANFGEFKILQSLTDADLSFIVLPLPVDNPLIDVADVRDVASHLGAEVANLAILLIATIRQIGGAAKLTVNTQAPVFLDTQRRLAWQHVIHSNKYTVQHEL